VEIEEANNVTADSAAKANPFEGYCQLCETISKVALTIRKKFTIMVATLSVFQIIIEVIYMNFQVDYIVRKKNIP